MNDDDDNQEEELDEFDSFFVFEKQQTPSPQNKMTSKQRRKKFLFSSPSSHDSSITSNSCDTSLSSFSLSPSRVLSGSSSFETAELIDYSTRSGSQVYEQATEPLLNNGQLFDGSPEDLILLKHLLWERAINQGWMEKGANIFSIPLTKDSDNSSIMNLLEHDGYFSSDRIREWAQEMIVDKKTRLAQNDYQLFWCLSNSISVELKKEIIKHRSTYCIDDTPIGVLYFHCILSKMESACSSTKSLKARLLVPAPCFKKVYRNIIVMVGLLAALIGIIVDTEEMKQGKGANNERNELPQPNDAECAKTYSSKSDFQNGLKSALTLEGELIIDRFNDTYFSPTSSSSRDQPVPRGGILLYNATIEEQRLLDDREYLIDDIEERNSENNRDTETPPDLVTKVIIDDYNHNDNNDGYDVVKSNGVHIFAGVGMTLFVLDASSGSLLSKTNIHTNDTEGILPCWETSNTDNCYFYDSVNSNGSQSNNHMGISSLFLSEQSITVIVKANLALKGADHFIQGYHQTRVFVYDISKMSPNNSELVLVARKDLQGSYKTAQMVGQNIHIVTSSSLKTSEYLKKELSPETMLRRRRKKGADYENYLSEAKKKLSKAAINISNKLIKEMENVGIQYNDVATIVRMLIRLPNTESTPSFTDSAVLQNLNIVYSFDSDQNYPDGNVDMSLSCIFLPTPGYTNPFYYSETNLVIAAEAYKENEDGSWVEVTALISLTLDGPMSQFQSYGVVRGSILSRLTMDLYNESNISTLYLRIATTTWGRWIPDGYSWKQNPEITNYVTVLRMNFSESVSMMENVGDLKDINVGGRMSSCKFHEKYGYISTYEAYDPLYTLDLTNNMAPTLSGNITVYGYKRYIHPISEKFIIAISIEEADGVAVGGDTLQIKMFNVKDLGGPFLVGHYMESLGAEGGAIYNHQALRYIPQSDILIYPTQCSVQNPHLCGFDAYDVSIYDSPTAAPTKFTRLFQILNHDSCKNSLHPRSLLFGNNITTLMGCTIKSTNILSREELWTIRIESQAI